MILKFKKLSPFAQFSLPANPGDAGYDLCVPTDIKKLVIPAFEYSRHQIDEHIDLTWTNKRLSEFYDGIANKVIINTKIALELPEGYYAQITEKSSVSGGKFNNKSGKWDMLGGIIVLAGTIDNGYRGAINVCLLNVTPYDFILTGGQKIAQLVIHKLNVFDLVEINELGETIRGESGFGSTGTH